MLLGRGVAGRVGWVALAIAVAILAPQVLTGDFYGNLLVTAAVYALMSLGLAVIMGQSGHWSFGQQAFLGFGAYVAVRLQIHQGVPVLVAILVGAIAGAILGSLVGYVALRRTRGMYLAIVTFALGEIAYIVALQWYSVTGGRDGILFTTFPSIVLPGVGRFTFNTNLRYYYLVLVVLVLVGLVIHWLSRSSIGAVLAALRQNEPLARSVGISPLRYYVGAFGLGSGITALAGGLLAYYLGNANPGYMGSDYLFAMLIIVILGGARTIIGPVLGAALYVLVPQQLGVSEAAREFGFGVILAAVLVAAPQGLYPLLLSATARIWGKAVQRVGRQSLRSRTARGLGEIGGAGEAPTALDSPRLGVVGSSRLATDAGPTGDHSGSASGRSRGRTILDARAIRKSFGGLTALAGVDLAVCEGEVIGLIGPNGSGKTTLINVLSGFLKPTEGEIYLDGARIDHATPERIARHGLTRTFQHATAFLESSLRENVLTATHVGRRSGQSKPVLSLAKRSAHPSVDPDAILRQVGLVHKAATPARELGLGEQKRLGIAVALATNPAVLLLDEPAAGMGDQEVAELARVVTQLRTAGIALVIVEHNMDIIARLCDRVIVLNFGQIIAKGSPGEIARNDQVIHAYLGKRGIPGAISL